VTRTDLVLGARFPFGRYAATPWFRSRREHVANAEWPPSPWRIARALVATAYRIGDDALVEATVALVQRLATVLPQYRLPPATEVVYAQWMPQLEFSDAPDATERSENGHTLLAISTDRELCVAWPGLELSADERSLLGTLLDSMPYLGQSVSVCAWRILGAPPAPCAGETLAVPREVERELGAAPGERAMVRLLVPQPTVSRAELEVSTADGLLKAMPAPPGSRWEQYVRVAPPRARLRARQPAARGVVHRLEGVLRPAVPNPYRPEAGARTASRPQPELRDLVARACGGLPPDATVSLADDDLDGRGERVIVRFPSPAPTSAIPHLLAPPRSLVGPGIECRMRLESVEWTDGEGREPRAARPRDTLLPFSLESAALPMLTDAIVVCETFRRRLLGVAGRRLGAHAIPPRLSGRSPDAGRIEDDHRHVHFLVAASAGREIDTFAVWCPEGLGAVEWSLVLATTLPPLLGAAIRLRRADRDPFSGPARRFRSHTPFLPVRHPKRRGGGLRDAPPDQVVQELERRGLPAPRKVEPMRGSWAAFRILRRAKPGCFPGLGAYGFQLEFDEPVHGPIALGRNSHFGMGLFLPAEP
jgi:hypothetical protein